MKILCFSPRSLCVCGDALPQNPNTPALVVGAGRAAGPCLYIYEFAPNSGAMAHDHGKISKVMSGSGMSQVFTGKLPPSVQAQSLYFRPNTR
jgi:hypothetical protein